MTIEFISNRQPSVDDNRFHGRWFLIGVLCCVMLFFASIAGGSWFLYRMYQTLPTVSGLQNITPSLASRVYAADGSLLHEFSIERRFWVPIEQMPRDLVNAVVATEDRRFYSHWGVDLKRIFGAVLVNIIRRDGYAQGASTITQQLARNVFLTQRQSFVRKIREALTAVQIESYYTKREILELYLNQVYLGAGVYGVQAASRRYFSKEVSELNLSECAVLAGTIQLPEHYRPDLEKNIKRVTRRRDVVLKSMVVMGNIDPQTFEQTKLRPVEASPYKPTARRAPYFVEMVRREVADRFGDDELYNGGLSIHTTLDPLAQDSAEIAVGKHLSTLQRISNGVFLDSTSAHVSLRMSKTEFLDNFDSLYQARADFYKTLPDSHKLRIVQVSTVALGVEDAAVKVLIGGRDFRESKFNRALQALRQPGSAFKPVVYAAALEHGYQPSTVVLDQPITLKTEDGDWRPENYSRRFYGPVPIRLALAKSINLVSIKMLSDIGASTVISLARQMGFDHRMPQVPALAIGTCEVTPLEITRAYGIFASGGFLPEPYFVTEVYDRTSRLIYKHQLQEPEEVLTPQQAYMMVSMMEDVVNRGTGIAVRSADFRRPAAGKTGTTNDYSDAWFVGYTPNYTCGVWVGGDQRRSMGYGITGSRGAIPIWVPTMKALHRDIAPEEFQRPEGIVTRATCSVTHEVATKYCPETYEEIYMEQSNLKTCEKHQRGARSSIQKFNETGGYNTDRPKDTGSSTTGRKLLF